MYILINYATEEQNPLTSGISLSVILTPSLKHRTNNDGIVPANLCYNGNDVPCGTKASACMSSDP